MSGVLRRVVVAVALVLAATLLAHVQPAQASDPFVATGHGPTVGTPVPGAYLTADLGYWNYPPDRDNDYQWLRDGSPIAGATSRDYLVQASDIGHQIAPYVVGHHGSENAHFTGNALTIRQIQSHLRLDVRRVHPRPDKARLVWEAISFMTTERPWSTDGGTVAAFRKRDHHWKQIGTSVITRNAAFVRLPWKHAPYRWTKVRVCYLGSDVVAVSCSRPRVVHRHS